MERNQVGDFNAYLRSGPWSLKPKNHLLPSKKLELTRNLLPERSNTKSSEKKKLEVVYSRSISPLAPGLVPLVHKRLRSIVPLTVNSELSKSTGACRPTENCYAVSIVFADEIDSMEKIVKKRKVLSVKDAKLTLFKGYNANSLTCFNVSTLLHHILIRDGVSNSFQSPEVWI